VAIAAEEQCANVLRPEPQCGATSDANAFLDNRIDVTQSRFGTALLFVIRRTIDPLITAREIRIQGLIKACVKAQARPQRVGNRAATFRLFMNPTKPPML